MAKLQSILETHPIALDLSMLGSGKTFSASYIARELGFDHVVVVAPVSVKPKWQQMKQEYGLPISHLIGYSELRSVKCKQPRHGLLVRRDYRETHVSRHTLETYEVEKTDFTPTSRWKRMVKGSDGDGETAATGGGGGGGVLLIFDEIQNLKNVNAQFSAARALLRTVVDAFAYWGRPEGPGPGRRSRALLLSGSPFDQVEQVTTLMRTMGVMRSPELGNFCPTTGVMRLTGMAEIAEHCSGLDPIATDAIMRDERGRHFLSFARGQMNRKVFELFQRVVKVRQASTMPPPRPPVQVHRRNAFYEVRDPLESARLERAVEFLMNVSAFDQANGTVNFAPSTASAGGAAGTGSIQKVASALMQVETAKLGTIERVARAALAESPTRKVSVHLNFSASVADMRRALADLEPLVLDGGTPAHRRGLALAQFQEPSAARRLLIGNVEVCSTGIDLDDKHGAFPRLALVSPNYSAITLYQLGQRFVRADSRSDATLHFVFGKHAHEVKVLQALARKSSVMRVTTQEQADEGGVVYPGDYPPWVEGEGDKGAEQEQEEVSERGENGDNRGESSSGTNNDTGIEGIRGSSSTNDVFRLVDDLLEHAEWHKRHVLSTSASDNEDDDDDDDDKDMQNKA